MARYRRRRGRSISGRIVSDSVYIANRLPWPWVIVFGAVSFCFFYWGVPALIAWHIATIQDKILRAAFDAALGRRSHWSQWLAVAIGLAAVFFAIRNYFAVRRLDREGERDVSLFSRVLARLID
jgi:ABC-type Fe3+ transport system permease subunit